jgi:hypothetical protein
MFGRKKGQAAIERPSFAARHHKGQAAMEYLMTYGWAILVIVIVLAFLMYYLSSLRPPETCSFFEPGFSCDVKKPVIVSESGTNDVYVIFRLDNQQGQAVDIKGVLCTTKSRGDIDKDEAYNVTGLRMVSGSSHEFTATDRIYCLDDAGERVILAPNADFRGTLVVVYNYVAEVEGAPERMATATLTGTVLEE